MEKKKMEIVKSLDEMTVILNELRLKHWQSSFKNDFMEMPSSEQIIILPNRQNEDLK
jgi:hypothetical protein